MFLDTYVGVHRFHGCDLLTSRKALKVPVVEKIEPKPKVKLLTIDAAHDWINCCRNAALKEHAEKQRKLREVQAAERA